MIDGVSFKKLHLLVTPRSRMIDLLLQRSLEMWETLCAASEAHLFAEVIPPLATNATLSTRHTDLEGHSVANRKAAHLRADGNDHTRRLVAE